MIAPLTREDIAMYGFHAKQQANPNLSRDPLPSESEEFLAAQAVKTSAQRMWTIAKLTAIKEAANRAIDAAMTKRTFDLHYSWEGHALYNAMHDLTGCDELYDTASEIAELAPKDGVQ